MLEKFVACSVEDCTGNSHYSKGARGLCGFHYRRLMKYERPAPVKKTPVGEAWEFFQEVVAVYDGSECLIWPYYIHPRGYGKMQRKGRKVVVSRYLCEITHGPPPSSLHQAAHSCGNGKFGCVAKSHLSWKTPTENAADKILHGTTNRGERNGFSKLTEKQALEIFALKGVIPQVVLAGKYGVCKKTVQSIHQGRNWSWLHA